MKGFRDTILLGLDREPLAAVLAEAGQWPPRRAVSPLIGLLLHPDERIKWHAVSALGIVVSQLAGMDLEAARTVMRRLIWSLNEESGGIGWGAPETLAEIMAEDGVLAAEFGHLLISYLRPDGSPLKLPALQRGLMWGLGRLAATRPGLLERVDAPVYLLPYLASEDAEVRGLAARALGLLRVGAARTGLMSLKKDAAEFLLYDRGERAVTTVGRIAGEALDRIDEGPPPPGN
jgi:HEAT repeat protein